MGLRKKVIWEKYYEGRKEVNIISFGSFNMSRAWMNTVSVANGLKG